MPEAITFLGEASKDTTGQVARTMWPFRAADWSFNSLGVIGILALSLTMPSGLVKEKGCTTCGMIAPDAKGLSS